MSSQFSSERLMAYADGALSEGEASEIEAAAAGDPEITSEIALYKKSRTRLATGFDAVLSEPVPPRLVAVMRARTEKAGSGKGNVSLLKRITDINFHSPRLAMAAAALLTIGVMATAYSAKFDKPGMSTSSMMYASKIDDNHPLANALQVSIGASAVDIGDNMIARAVVSYQLADGQLCREFEIIAPSAASVGIACRVESGWQIEAQTVAKASMAGRNEIVTASGPDSKVIAQTLERLGVGIGLDAQQEACAASESWTQISVSCSGSSAE